MAWATSSAATRRPVGWRGPAGRPFRVGVASSSRRTQGVSAVPGSTQLTRTPSPTWSAAMARVDRALGGAVEGAPGQAGHGRDRAGVDDRRGRGAPQVGEGGPAGPDDPEQVDVQHAAPLVLGVVLDRARCADAGVVDQHVQGAEALGDRGHGGPHRVVVGDVGGQRQRRGGRGGRVQVEEATLAPRAASSRAVARPIPEPPPVTATTSPSKSPATPAPYPALCGCSGRSTEPMAVSSR